MGGYYQDLIVGEISATTKSREYHTFSYSRMCLRSLLNGIDHDLAHAGGDIRDIIEGTFARIIGDYKSPRAMPFTSRVRQASMRLRARLGCMPDGRLTSHLGGL